MSASGVRSGPDYEVAIVGCGPVGVALAVLLGQLGRSVVALERWPEPYRQPRAVHFDHEVGRILQACGIGDGLRSIIEPAEVYEWRNAEGLTLLRFGRVGPGPSGWPSSSMFCQPELEAMLERRAEELASVDVRRGTTVVGLDQCDDRVVLRDAAGGTVSAHYVVGCDGANSTVRDLVGIDMVDLGFFHDWLIVDVVLDEPRVFDPINLQICDPQRPTTAVSGGPGRRRWEFMCLPHETIEELNDEARAWQLLAPWDVHPGNARLERHAVYRFQARHAERWRLDRVTLAGDAAHQMPPFAGQGMCAGLRDAANLAWKLDLVLAGAAPDTLLDTYQEERLPSAKGAIELSIELGKVICVADPAEAAARDEAMSAAVTGELTPVADQPGITGGVVDAAGAHAGDLFPQAMIADRLFDDVHGAGWRLVTTAHDDGGPGFDVGVVEWFASIGGSVVTLDGPDAEIRRWFDERGVTWALQRPDFRLYGTARDAAGAAQLLHHLRQHLATAPTTTGLDQ